MTNRWLAVLAFLLLIFSGLACGNSATPTPASLPQVRLTNTPTVAPAVAATGVNGPRANTAANLRAGPGTNYPIVGSITAGQALDIIARTSTSDWYQLRGDAWVSGELVTGAPVVPVAAVIPTAPAATSAPAASSAPTQAGVATNPNAFTCIGGCAVPPDASCAIKGNVNSDHEKIYHTPGQRDYDKTDIKPAEGDLWFCIEAEAKAAGFRPAQR